MKDHFIKNVLLEKNKYNVAFIGKKFVVEILKVYFKKFILILFRSLK